MNVYKHYVSGEHDKHYFRNGQSYKRGLIKLRPPSGQFDITPEMATNVRSAAEWLLIFPSAAFFSGFDPILFGRVVTVVYKNTLTSKISTVSITKFGCNVYENIILDSSSRFWPACENLTSCHRNSNVKKALAISNLKNFNKLWNNRGIVELNKPWDETNAGTLASAMSLMDGFTPSELGERLLSLGLLQMLSVASILIDVVYDNFNGDEKVTAQNNALVLLLGTQIDQLHDPILEYSTQTLDYVYTPPSSEPARRDLLLKALSINAVIKELLIVQTNYTMALVDLLQDFITPLRASILAQESTEALPDDLKVNQIFPHTIDEIARINCILHTSIKSAQAYGFKEIFKVLADILPFFIKAFVRHEANIGLFKMKFSKFLKQSHIFNNVLVNRKSYTPQQVDSIISGFMFELPKLKLIVMRLYDTILSEQTKLGGPVEDNTELTCNYQTVIDTIDTLGFGVDLEDLLINKRILKPSGRLLVELSKGWPAELQHGWNSRRVLAVYEMVSSFSKESEILIISVDHVFLLEVSPTVPKDASINLADMLTNSLVNRDPHINLPYDLDLKVKYWCEIDRIIAKSFEGSHGECLSLTTYGGNSFKLRDLTKPIFSLIYDFLHDSEAISSCGRIMNSITKAQVRHKSTAFHLFKHSEPHLNMYYCAHDKEKYGTEEMKAATVILLNISKNEIDLVFAANPHVGMVLALSSLNDYTMHVFGYNRQHSYEVKEVVSTDNLVKLLKQIIAKSMNSIFHSSFMTKELILAGESLLEDFYTAKKESGPDVQIEKGNSPILMNLAGKRISKIEAFEVYSQYPSAKISDETLENKLEVRNKQEEVVNKVKKFVKEKKAQKQEAFKLSKDPGMPFRRRKGTFRVLLLKLTGKDRSLVFSNNDYDTDDANLENFPLSACKQFIYKRLYKPESLLRKVSREIPVPSPALSVARESSFASKKLRRDPILSFAEHYSQLKKSKGIRWSTVNVNTSPECNTPTNVIPELKFPNEDFTENKEKGTEIRDVFASLPVASVQPAVYPAVVEPLTIGDTAISNSSVKSKVPYLYEKLAVLVNKKLVASSVASFDSERNLASCLKVEDFFTSPSTKQRKNKIEKPPLRVAFSHEKINEKSAAFPPLTAKPFPAEQIREVDDEDAMNGITRELTNEDVAKALEHASADEVAPAVNRRYSIFQSLPSTLLRVDGMPNWVPLDGLSTEFAFAISASATSTTAGSDSPRKRIYCELPSQPMARYVLDDNVSIDTLIKFLTEEVAMPKQNSLPDPAKQIEESATSSVIVSEFERQLEKDFSSGLRMSDMVLTEQNDCDASTIYADYELMKSSVLDPRLPGSRLTFGRDQNNFSPLNSDDFAQCTVVSSSCSDLTLHNDFGYEDENLICRAEDFGSLLYLSEMINGTAVV